MSGASRFTKCLLVSFVSTLAIEQSLAQQSLCTAFSSSGTESWRACTFAPNISVSPSNDGSINGPSDYYLRLEDDSGASALCSGTQAVGAPPSPYRGDWRSYPVGSTFCFDARVFNGGQFGANQSVRPGLSFLSGNYVGGSRAQFVTTDFITEDGGQRPGWRRFCAPVHTVVPGQQLPSNADGYWVIGASRTATATWNSILANVTDVLISADVSPWATEIVGYDNICVTRAAEVATLKVCKVAGPGVAIGAPFTFTTDRQNDSIKVPAGPAPGGYCKVIGTNYPIGRSTTVRETAPIGYGVTGIAVNPSAPHEIDLANKQVLVAPGPGVTEIRFTNERRRGFLEICKEADEAGAFTFNVNPGNLGPFVVPAGACTPAIEVQSGEVRIQEQISSNFVMTGACATLPGDRQISCTPRTQTSVVAVADGDVSTQTIAFIQNRAFGPSPRPNLGSPAPFQKSVVAEGARDGATVTSVRCASYAHPGADLVVCNASVRSAGAPRQAPSGFVSFSSDTGRLAIIPLKTDGTASLALPRREIKGRKMIAAYDGDGNFRSSQSAPANGDDLD
ncbi:MAG: hypothetical protein ABL957_09740 [Parvularculaceae bacterium]